VIALLTDFGISDSFVGIMKAIILTIAPETVLVDLTHAIPPQDITAGAWALATAVPYLPPDIIMLAVVDPGVGTKRRAVAICWGRRIFVGPDNGLATPLLLAEEPDKAIILDRPEYWLEQPDSRAISSTFHGRDIFAPIAARLAHGFPFEFLGSKIDTASLVRISWERAYRDGNIITGSVLVVDHFGNLITNIGSDLVAELFQANDINATVGNKQVHARALSFGAGPEYEAFWYPDSSGHAGIAWRNGNAAEILGITRGTSVRVCLY
jgi:S-adenosyl-L-methionine hydrolase (adenosine-forming)